MVQLAVSSQRGGARTQAGFPSGTLERSPTPTSWCPQPCRRSDDSCSRPLPGAVLGSFRVRTSARWPIPDASSRIIGKQMCRLRISAANIRPHRFHQNRTVSWQISIPRSNSRSLDLPRRQGTTDVQQHRDADELGRAVEAAQELRIAGSYGAAVPGSSQSALTRSFARPHPARTSKRKIMPDGIYHWLAFFAASCDATAS